jgi:hypothetical protein
MSGWFETRHNIIATSLYQLFKVGVFLELLHHGSVLSKANTVVYTEASHLLI